MARILIRRQSGPEGLIEIDDYQEMMQLVRWIGAIAAAMLPRRHWPALDGVVPASRAAAAASLLTMGAGVALGFVGFFAHLDEVASINNAAYLEAAVRYEGEKLALPSALSGLSFFTFVLLTPQGWLSSYLAVSGLVRTIGSQFDDPHGDFVLTLLDAGARRVATSTLRLGGIANRHRLEGPLVRDRVVAGNRVGLAVSDVVIIASRIKDGWEPGTIVLSNRGEFRILACEDRTIDGRLRRLYPLARVADLEAFRRTVTYEFPENVAAELAVSPEAMP
jgi:hypothetical protein